MTKVVYLNEDGVQPSVNWHGRLFQHGEEVELDDAKDADLIRAVKENPQHFKVLAGDTKAVSPQGASPPAGNTKDDVARQQAIHSGGSKPDDSAKQHDENDSHNRMAGENVGMRSKTNPTQT